MFSRWKKHKKTVSDKLLKLTFGVDFTPQSIKEEKIDDVIIEN